MRNKMLNWIEISSSNLENNINQIKSIIPDDTKIMAVVKGNAYGHGSVLVARKLRELGINDFAVATIDEGIELRKNNIDGNILILGFTDISRLNDVIKYDLIQTVVDYNYFLILKRAKLSERLKCHIKINTGMNRLGIDYNDFSHLDKIYKSNKLNILGTFSHLCVSDSSLDSDILFTKRQIKNFDECIFYLKKKYNVGLLHLQGSYGIINYSYLKYDYVRAGIIMYGVNDLINSYQKIKLDLKPVLSLKAKIVSIRNIQKGSSVGYGSSYVASKNMKIATVAIGYFDGIDRLLSNNLVVKVGKYYVNVVGKICMNQLMIDITDTFNVKVLDVVDFIDGDLRVEDMACRIDSISHGILSRLNKDIIRVLR